MDYFVALIDTFLLLNKSLLQHIKEFNGYYEKIADTLADEIRKEGY